MNIFKLEFLKLRKKTRSWLGPILVFWLIMIAYPLTVEYLQENMIIGFFSVLWIAILISMMLATEDFFIEDFNDGFLEQTVIKKYSFSILISSKIFTYWLLIGLPISILSFVFSLGTSENMTLSLLILPLSILATALFFLTGSFSFFNNSKDISTLVSKTYSHGFLFLTASFLIYVWLAVTDNFSVQYIASHSNSNLPTFYKISSICIAKNLYVSN